MDDLDALKLSPGVNVLLTRLVLGKFGPRPIGTQSGLDQTPWSWSRSGIFPKIPDHLVSGLGILILDQDHITYISNMLIFYF